MGVALLAGATLAASVAAQEITAPDTLEEVVVTSQRRAQPLLKVPVSVTVLNSEALINLNASNFEDFARSVPGLSFTSDGRFQRGGMQPVLRGVALIGGIFPVTAMYFGETPVQPSRTNLGMIDPNLFDISSVEVLRGPQGDLYGSSSMGGAIKILPNAPDPSAFDIATDVRVGALNKGGLTSEVAGMINIPLADDRAALRMSAMYSREDGYTTLIDIEQLAGAGGIPEVGPDQVVRMRGRPDQHDLETITARVAIRWNVTDNFTVTPSYFTQQFTADGLNYVSGPLSASYGSAVDIDYGFDEGTRSTFSIKNLETNLELGWATLLTSTTLFDVSRSGNFGGTGIIDEILGGGIVPTTIEDVETEEHLIQEVRLNSRAGLPVEFTGGLFYRDVTYGLAQLFYNDALIPVLGTGLLFSRQGEDSRTKEKAAFARVTWHVTDRLEVSPGMRYSKYDNHALIPTTHGLFGYPTLDNPASDTDVSPSLSVRYAPSEQLSIYTRAANGFRPGYGMRLNYPAACLPELAALGVDPNADVMVDSDSLWSYEVGMKGRFLDGRVSTNISAYRIDWEDLQLSIALDCGFNVAGNAGKVKNNGAEFEMVTLLTPDLTTQLSIGYVDAKLGDDIPTLGGSSGDRLISVPKLSYALGAQYDWTVREHGAFARLDYAYQGDAYFGFRFIESQRRPAYGLLSGRLGMDVGDFQIALYGKNLLNEDKLNLCQRDNFRAVAPDYSTCMVRPRELGLQVRWAPGAGSLARK